MGSQFHAKHKALDMVRRRLWTRRMIISNDKLQNVAIFNLNLKEDKKEDKKEEVIVKSS